jgi:ABC-type branched-subunit amino acid transport system substrate-binding protein
MSTTDESTKSTGDRPPAKPSGASKALRRYGAIGLVVVLLAVLFIVLGRGGGDDKKSSSSNPAVASQEDLIRSGPMTPQKAELEGKKVDFGPNCDTTTGRIKLVSVYAPPCVEPFTGDNGGATASGVTGDTVKVIFYRTDPKLDPLTAATVAGAGADTDPKDASDTVEQFATLYNKLFETYGRKVDVEVFTGTGAPDDVEKAKADAIAIAAKKPFMVIGGPAQASQVFASELASRKVICGPVCALALSDSFAKQYAPYLWQAGPTPEQANDLAAELIGNLAGPGKAAMAGDAATKAKDRVYAVLHYDDAAGDYAESFKSLKKSLADRDINLKTDIQFTLDLAKAQENARTYIAKLKDAGVTTVIYTGDPLTPGSLTKEATAQNYHPEWILGSSVLMDTSIFARQTDPNQWKNGFGIGLTGARGEQKTDGAFRIYDWAYGGLPPSNTANVLEPPIRTVFTGIMLAGPKLTADTFADGLYRYPHSGGGPTEPGTSRGDSQKIWPGMDWGGSDDAAVIWFDPAAKGTDEVGNEGTGLYRYADGGKRYTLGHFPKTAAEAGLFDDASSVTVFKNVPKEDTTPDYPPPK